MTAPVSTLRPCIQPDVRRVIDGARQAARHGQRDFANVILDVSIVNNVTSVALWNEKLLVNRDRIDVVRATFSTMQSLPVRPNRATFRALSWASDITNDAAFGLDVFAAMHHFDAPRVRDVRTYRNLVSVFTKNYQPQYVWAVFGAMQQGGGAPCGDAYHEIVDSLISLRVPYQAHEALVQMRCAGFVPRSHLVNRTLELYRCIEKPDQVWDLYNTMGALGVPPNSWTFDVVQRAFSQYAERLHAATLRAGMTPEIRPEQFGVAIHEREVDGDGVVEFAGGR